MDWSDQNEPDVDPPANIAVFRELSFDPDLEIVGCHANSAARRCALNLGFIYMEFTSA